MDVYEVSTVAPVTAPPLKGVPLNTHRFTLSKKLPRHSISFAVAKGHSGHSTVDNNTKSVKRAHIELIAFISAGGAMSSEFEYKMMPPALALIFRYKYPKGIPHG